MKPFKLISILLITGFLSAFIDGAEDISNAIKAGDSKQLASHMGASVELTIASKESVYSKLQAEQILKNFFINNIPQSFSILHKGSSKEGTMYVIGNLVTKAGKTYRTSFYFKQTNKVDMLKELRFENE